MFISQYWVIGRAPIQQPQKRKRFLYVCCKHVANYDVVIVGGGIAGLTLAATLTSVLKWNRSVLVIEQSPQQRAGGSAIGLWTNAWKCLDAIGNSIGTKLRGDSMLLSTFRIMRATDGKVLKRFQLSECTGEEHEFRYIPREKLMTVIRDLYLSSPGSEIWYGSSLENVKEEGEYLLVSCSNSIDIRCRLVVGADGIHSSVRKILKNCPRWPKNVNFNGYYAFRGAVSIERVPEDVKNELSKENWSQTVSQIWGKGLRVGVAPINNSHWYWFVTVNENRIDYPKKIKENPFMRLSVLKHLTEDIVYPIPQLVIHTNPNDILFHQCSDSIDPLIPRNYLDGWLSKSHITLVGDAAHPTTPNLAQGGAMAMEDALVLANNLYKHSSDLEHGDILLRALYSYENARLFRTQRLVIQSHIMGKLLQLDNNFICYIRDTIGVQMALADPSSFVKHAIWDPPTCFL
eukprot:jgi/Galph1/5093/GphlegSOOS_G3711.1